MLNGNQDVGFPLDKGHVSSPVRLPPQYSQPLQNPLTHTICAALLPLHGEARATLCSWSLGLPRFFSRQAPYDQSSSCWASTSG